VLLRLKKMKIGQKEHKVAFFWEEEEE